MDLKAEKRLGRVRLQSCRGFPMTWIRMLGVWVVLNSLFSYSISQISRLLNLSRQITVSLAGLVLKAFVIQSVSFCLFSHFAFPTLLASLSTMPLVVISPVSAISRASKSSDRLGCLDGKMSVHTVKFKLTSAPKLDRLARGGKDGTSHR